MPRSFCRSSDADKSAAHSALGWARSALPWPREQNLDIDEVDAGKHWHGK